MRYNNLARKNLEIDRKYSIQQVLDPSKKAIFIGDPSTVPGLEETIGSNLSGIGNYGLRSVVLARDRDKVLVPQESLSVYNSSWRDHLERNGLNGSKIMGVKGEGNLANRIKKDSSFKNIGNSSIIVPYFAGHDEFEAAKHMGGNLFGPKKEIADIYNDKVNLREVLEDMNSYKLSKGGIFREGDSYEDLESIVKKTMEDSSKAEVFIRRGEGASGFGQYKIDANKGNIESQIKDVYEDTMKKGGNYLVEEFLSVKASPSVIAVFDDAGVFPLAQTSQVLHGTKHAGNVIDLNGNTKYIDFALPLLKDMHAKGYRGQGGIDLIETNDGSLYICEVNARGTGAFFPASVLSRINESVANYQMNMVRSDTIKINAFEDHNHFYELLSEFGLEPIHNKGVGIIDINPGKIISVDNKGKVDAQIAILGKNNVDIMKTRQKFISLFS